MDTPAHAGRDDGPPTVPSDWTALRARPRPDAPATAHALEFSGSGSEYFRIWIVNLLLTLLSFGLYYPWAKVRKLRYFYANTRLAGHGFDFHGEPRRMLRGFLLVGALFAVYALAGQVSAWASLFALVVLAAIWPALTAASMRFRLSQTSWRGLRFAFAGDTASTYRALLPGFGALILVLAASAALVPTPMPEGMAPRPPSGFKIVVFVLAMALLAGLLPLTLWLLKRWQHDHYQYASVRTRFTAAASAFYKLGGKALGLVLLITLALGIAVAAVGFGGGAGRARPLAALAVTLLLVVGLYGMLLFVLQPYLVSRLQNLIWNATESRSVGFRSTLRFGALARLMLLNGLLVLLTLGLYWPFAAIATARLRLQSVSVLARGDLDALVARGGRRSDDAAGDAAADVFGIDLGL